jgi:hypothetical protein
MLQDRLRPAGQHPQQRANPAAEQEANKGNERRRQNRYAHRCHAHAHTTGARGVYGIGLGCAWGAYLAYLVAGLRHNTGVRPSGAHGHLCHPGHPILGKASHRNGVVTAEPVHPEEASEHQDQTGQA